MLRAAGLCGGAVERDPQDHDAVVIAQEPPAGQLVPPGSIVGFRTRIGCSHTARRAGFGWDAGRPLLPVLAGTGDARWCRPSDGSTRCRVRLGVPADGVWTARVAKRSSPPAAVEITVAGPPVRCERRL